MRKRRGSHSSKRHPNLVEEILGAAEAVGSDGKGRDGLRGYLISLAKKHPKDFLTQLLARLVDLEPAKVDAPRVYQTREEIEAEMKRRGLPVPERMFS